MFICYTFFEIMATIFVACCQDRDHLGVWNRTADGFTVQKQRESGSQLGTAITQSGENKKERGPLGGDKGDGELSCCKRSLCCL